jgi:hypothetical protein
MRLKEVAYVGPMPPLRRVSGRNSGDCLRGDLPCHHKVISLAHTTDGLDDLGFIVLDDFDPF